MSSRVCGMIGVLAGLALVGCHHDPLNGLDGTPAYLTKNFSEIDLSLSAATKTGTITASVVDGRATPLEDPVVFSSRNSAVATAVIDTSYHPVSPTSSRALVRAIAAGTTYVNLSGAGLSDSVKIVVTP